MSSNPVEDPEPYLAALDTAGDDALPPLLRIVHQHITAQDYQRALSLLFLMASRILEHAGAERALVVHTIAIASLLAQRGELFQSAQMLRMGAPYAGPWPEREEIISMSLILVEMSLREKDFRSARGAVAALSACAHPRTKIHQTAIDLAIRVNREESAHKSHRT